MADRHNITIAEGNDRVEDGEVKPSKPKRPSTQVTPEPNKHGETIVDQHDHDGSRRSAGEDYTK